jgi:hypothetical protein
MRFILAVIGIALVGVVGWETLALQQLKSANQALQAELAAATAEKEASQSAARVSTTGGGSSADEHAELLRLRGELAALRRAIGTGKGKGSNGQGLASTVPPETAAQPLPTVQEFQTLATQTVDSMKSLGMASKIFANANDNRLPSTMDELRQGLKNDVVEVKDPAVLDTILERLELMPHERALTTTDSDRILLREKATRMTPDGRYARAYTLVDGSVITVQLPQDMFQSFETDHTARKDVSGAPPQAVGVPPN